LRINSTIILLAVAALLGSFIWFVERRAETTEQRQERSRRALHIEPERISYLQFVAGDFSATCKKKDGEWMLTAPVKARAASGEMDRILWGLKGLERSDVVTAKEQEGSGIDRSAYGLGEPRATITIGEAGRSRTFSVGRDAPVGEAVYVGEAGHDEIIVTASTLLSYIPKDLTSLRDRHLFTGGSYDVTKLDVHRPNGFLQLVRANAPKDKWLIQQPLNARADTQGVGNLLDALHEGRVAEFIADDVVEPTSYGLGKDAVHVTLWGGNEDPGQTLYLGNVVEGVTNQVYGRLADYPSVFTVPADLMDRVSVPVETLRDRRLITLDAADVGRIVVEQGDRVLEAVLNATNGWQLVRPVPAPVDVEALSEFLRTWTQARIGTFIDDAGTNEVVWSSEGNVLSLTLARTAPASAAEPGEGAETRPGDRTVLVMEAAASNGVRRIRVQGEPSLYGLDATHVPLPSVEQLDYRDRAVANVAVEDVRSVRIIAGGATQEVARIGDGSFAPVEAGAGAMDADAVQDILGLLRPLRALRYEADNPADLAAYGLAEPQAVLTLGLVADKGIEKSLLLGGAAAPDGTYAQMRGEDRVFVLPDMLVELLHRRRLYAPAAPPAE
jgi:hypothetical protein